MSRSIISCNSAVVSTGFAWRTSVSARRRYVARVGPFRRLPEPRPNHALRAVEEHALDLNDDREVRQLAVRPHRLAQFRVGDDGGSAAHAKRLADAGDQENQPDIRVDEDVRGAYRARLLPGRSGIASVFSSSTFTNPAGSPFGETSKMPAASLEAIRMNGEEAMKRRQKSSIVETTLFRDEFDRLIVHIAEVSLRADNAAEARGYRALRQGSLVSSGAALRRLSRARESRASAVATVCPLVSLSDGAASR